MERATKELSMADIAGWGSALVTFGLIQGALYLKAYWGHFGLDPFQYVAVSEIALAGLAGIGLALGMMLVAILLGDWLGNKLTSVGPDRRVLGFLAPAGQQSLMATRAVQQCDIPCANGFIGRVAFRLIGHGFC